jgi:hypothetical protein
MQTLRFGMNDFGERVGDCALIEVSFTQWIRTLVNTGITPKHDLVA